MTCRSARAFKLIGQNEALDIFSFRRTVLVLVPSRGVVTMVGVLSKQVRVSSNLLKKGMRLSGPTNDQSVYQYTSRGAVHL